ncbi:unnamed protein product [Hymenolepis diminuta]|uniref:Uncharacterized protein n=1 Tax=Hymenolepis diminuta TaxID=6216 RepID=A0A564YT40_HYMDI|nr:unnamed protein product [Hymenolepis diminuta]
MVINWPPRGREKSVVNALLTHSFRTREFVRRVHGVAWYDGRKSWEVYARHPQSSLYLSL